MPETRIDAKQKKKKNSKINFNEERETRQLWTR